MKHTKACNAAIAAFVLLLSISSCKTAPPPAPPAPPKPLTNRLILIETSYGNMVIALSDSTPQHRDNFIKLVEQGFYDSLLFHRVINGFMIQGGDPESKTAQPGDRLGNGGTSYRVPAEFNPHLFHKKGVIAAARDNNPDKSSSGCQFYIAQGKRYTDDELNQVELTRLNGRKLPAFVREAYKTVGGIPHLDTNYTVFGEMISGQDVIDKIAAAARDNADRPYQDVRMFIKILR